MQLAPHEIVVDAAPFHILVEFGPWHLNFFPHDGFAAWSYRSIGLGCRVHVSRA